VPSSEVVRGGTLLASVRVEMYGRARELAGQDRAAHAALGEQNFERVQTVARGVPATAGDVASAAQECGDLIATFRSESFSAPSFYRLEQANQEHEAFSEIAATVDPAAGGVASVGRALSRGAAGRELLASDQYDTAEIAYEEALGAIDAARQQFARLGGPPPMFEAAVERGRCGLDQLSEAYSAAREGIQAARKGDSDQADKRLATAEDRLETYLADCLEA
jgi:flagellar motility protein MotE (MotC chaperone)